MNLGMPGMIFIALLALLLFGPKKLPQMARELGKALNEFKRASNEFKNQLETEIAQVEAVEREKAVRTPAPAEFSAAPAQQPIQAVTVEPRILPPSEPGFATTIGQAVESGQLESMPPVADVAHDPDPKPLDTASAGVMNFDKTPLRESNA